MTAGALTLVAFDGQRGSNEVTYTYTVTNTGDFTASNVEVTDDRIDGVLREEDSLAAGDSFTFDVSVLLEKTTTNIATVTGDSFGEVCSDKSGPVTVTVQPRPVGGGSKSKSPESRFACFRKYIF